MSHLFRHPAQAGAPLQSTAIMLGAIALAAPAPQDAQLPAALAAISAAPALWLSLVAGCALLGVALIRSGRPARGEAAIFIAAVHALLPGVTLYQIVLASHPGLAAIVLCAALALIGSLSALLAERAAWALGKPGCGLSRILR